MAGLLLYIMLMTKSLENKTILLVISGGIAAYKSLELIRMIRKSGGDVRCILTKGGAQFVTPLSVAALTEEQVYTDLWSLKDETEMGHIRLSREADLIIVAPASADILARMAGGLGDDLASTTLLAANKPIMIAPAMNQEMWDNPATQANLRKLREQGLQQIGPAKGVMACGEQGLGRMAEPQDIFDTIQDFFYKRPLKGMSALVTAGPTYEPIDPVRFIGNRSSGKQGYAIAESLARAGADVTLVSGPTALPDPEQVRVIRIETAVEMLAACEDALPADIAVCAAAVGDWAPQSLQAQKIKKGKAAPVLKLKENPDILKTIATSRQRPDLVIGFAAETENLHPNAQEKLRRKSCDWILANNVAENIFGSEENHVYLVRSQSHMEWSRASKRAVAQRLTQEIIEHFQSNEREITVQDAAE